MATVTYIVDLERHRARTIKQVNAALLRLGHEIAKRGASPELLAAHDQARVRLAVLREAPISRLQTTDVGMAINACRLLEGDLKFLFAELTKETPN